MTTVTTMWRMSALLQPCIKVRTLKQNKEMALLLPHLLLPHPLSIPLLAAIQQLQFKNLLNYSEKCLCFDMIVWNMMLSVFLWYCQPMLCVWGLPEQTLIHLHALYVL